MIYFLILHRKLLMATRKHKNNNFSCLQKPQEISFQAEVVLMLMTDVDIQQALKKQNP